MLKKDITANVSVDRLVNINLNNNTLVGNLSFTTSEAGNIELGKGSLTGNLTVNTPNVSFTNLASIQGTTLIKDVANNTFTNKGTLNSVIIQDPNGTRFVNGANGVIVSDFTVDTDSDVKLEGKFAKIVLTKSSNLELKENTVVNKLEVDEGVESNIIGGEVQNIAGSGNVDVKKPKVIIKDYVTYKVNKLNNDYYGVQARITLPEQEQKLLGSDDRVVVSLMSGDNVLSTSSSIYQGKDALLSKYFVNKFSDEMFYASTLFVPNGKYPSSAWDTTKWNAINKLKPDTLKVEIKRGDYVVSSVISKLPLNEKFVDGTSKEALSWESVLEHNAIN